MWLTVSIGLSVVYGILAGITAVFLLAYAAAGVGSVGDIPAFIFSGDGMGFVWVPLMLIGASWVTTILVCRRATHAYRDWYESRPGQNEPH